MKEKVRILIADDHDIVRRGLKPLIEAEWGWEVCAEARDGQEALAMVEKHDPAVVVLDVGMPRLNGVDLTREIKKLRPETEVLAFTGTDSETLVHELFAAGARACVLKSDGGEHVVPAIKALLTRQPYLGSRVSQIVFASYLKGGAPDEKSVPGRLTLRERGIVQMLAEGHSNKEIASSFGTSVKTVETQRAAIMRKLNFTAFSELVRYAVRNHIVQP